MRELVKYMAFHATTNAKPLNFQGFFYKFSTGKMFFFDTRMRGGFLGRSAVLAGPKLAGFFETS